MASPAVERSLAATVGKVDYDREQRVGPVRQRLADDPVETLHGEYDQANQEVELLGKQRAQQC